MRREAGMEQKKRNSNVAAASDVFFMDYKVAYILVECYMQTFVMPHATAFMIVSSPSAISMATVVPFLNFTGKNKR